MEEFEDVRSVVAAGVPSFGGEYANSELYAAAGLGRLGIRAEYVTFVSESGKSDSLDGFFASERVRLSGVGLRRVPAPDGYCGVVNEWNSAVFFTGEFAAYSEICAKAAGEMCERCRALEIPLIFDPNLSSVNSEKYGIINEIAAMAEIFLPSADDAKLLCGLEDPEEIAQRYLKSGARKVVVKLDKKGAYYKSAKESGYTPTFRADKVVDTRGAGNAFAAGLISGVTEGIPLGEAVVRANACGCIAIQKEGALDCLPTAEALREYMLGHRFAVDGCKDF